MVSPAVDDNVIKLLLKISSLVFCFLVMPVTLLHRENSLDCWFLIPLLYFFVVVVVLVFPILILSTMFVPV